MPMHPTMMFPASPYPLPSPAWPLDAGSTPPMPNDALDPVNTPPSPLEWCIVLDADGGADYALVDPVEFPPAVVDRFTHRCHVWLETARHASADPGIHQLIDDLHQNLRDIGKIDDEFQGVVVDALDSIAAAIDLTC